MPAYAGAVRVVRNRRRAMTACRSGAGSSCLVGNRYLLLLRATASGVCRAWDRSRAHSVERRQAPGDLRHDGIFSALGATLELAGNGASVPDQLGSGVSVGGMVCRVGSGAPGTARGRIHWRGRNSLGTRLEGTQLLDCDLPNRRRMPSFAVGGTPAFASH